MPRKSTSEANRQRLLPLKGATLIEMISSPNEDEFLDLLFEKDGKHFGVCVQRDPEGNGPGWLHVYDIPV